jgi:hypothetical protein
MGPLGDPLAHLLSTSSSLTSFQLRVQAAPTNLQASPITQGWLGLSTQPSATWQLLCAVHRSAGLQALCHGNPSLFLYNLVHVTFNNLKT